MTESGQLQPEETLDDRGVDDVLDEGYSPPEKLRGSTAKGVTPSEQAQGESIDERLPQEEPDDQGDLGGELDAGTTPEDDPAPPGQVGDRRSGRLVADDGGAFDHRDQDLDAVDVGIDGGAASAEEAAVHVTEDSPESAPEPGQG